jgi:hypothetical protein
MRLALLHRILQIIEESPGFSQGDFEVTHKIAAGAHTFTIAYRPFPAYCMTATVVRGSIQGSISPGEVAETEHFKAIGQDEFIRIVRAWLDWTHEELLARPVVRQLEEQRAQLEVLFESLERLPRKYFTQEEATDLAGRLDDVHADIAGRLAKLGLEDAKLKARMREIEADVGVLKKTTQVMNKPNWARMFVRRCMSWIRDANNRAIVKDVTEIARKLLAPHSS